MQARFRCNGQTPPDSLRLLAARIALLLGLVKVHDKLVLTTCANIERHLDVNSYHCGFHEGDARRSIRVIGVSILCSARFAKRDCSCSPSLSVALPRWLAQSHGPSTLNTFLIQTSPTSTHSMFASQDQHHQKTPTVSGLSISMAERGEIPRSTLRHSKRRRIY